MPPTSSAPPGPVLRHITDRLHWVDVSRVQTDRYSSNQTYTVFSFAFTHEYKHSTFPRVLIHLEDTPSLDVEYIGSLSTLRPGFLITHPSLDHIGMRGIGLDQKYHTATWKVMAFTRSLVLDSTQSSRQASKPDEESDSAVCEGTCVWEYETPSEQKFLLCFDVLSVI